MNFDNSMNKLETLRNKSSQSSDIAVARKEWDKLKKKNSSDSVWESNTYDYLMK